MVNSPSRPNSRPVDPPALVECGGMTPLWHRETCLPIERPARSAPLLCDLTASVRVRGGDGPVPTLVAVEFGSIKAKTPAIKANQASSRHPLKISKSASHPRHPHPSARRFLRHWMLGVRCWMLDVGCFGSIKAKTPAIKANQASSRHPLKISKSAWHPRLPIRPRASSSVIGCWAFDVGCWMFWLNQGKNPSNQASSRQIKASAKILTFMQPNDN